VRAMQEGQLDACCGPAYVPPETAKLATCVAAARPALCLTSFGDAMARSNLAFSKDALRRAGGFERKYKTFDADMDLCRKIEGTGAKLGYSPVALVWNLRPDTLWTFLSTQGSYGRVDAKLGRWSADRCDSLPRLGRAGLFGCYQRALRMLLVLTQSAEWIVLWTIAAVLARFVGLSPFAALGDAGGRAGACDFRSVDHAPGRTQVYCTSDACIPGVSGTAVARADARLDGRARTLAFTRDGGGAACSNAAARSVSPGR